MKNNRYIKIIDSTDIQDPQVSAMLQAFYSRSQMPIEERLASLNEGDAETKTERIRNAMKSYYVDYGHQSIGDCGGCTVYIENVSMLAAKAIQDHPLYNGQECSTRYIDFSQQEFLHNAMFSKAIGHENAQQRANYFERESAVQARWRGLYMDALPKVFDYVTKTVDPNLVLSSKIAVDKRAAAFERTCKAIAFDYCRGLLPAGAATSLAWTSTFRVFDDHLRFLSFHPLQEVRDIAKSIYSQLAERYPASFKREILNPGDAYEHPAVYYTLSHGDRYDYSMPQVESHVWGNPAQLHLRLGWTPIQRYRHAADHSVDFEIKGLLDFGSFRDLARHRPGLNRNAYLGMTYDFNTYYSAFFNKVDSGIMNTVDSILSTPRFNGIVEDENMYLLPMGMNVPVHLKWNLGQLRYVTRLRTKTSVHPTLRRFMSRVAQEAYMQIPALKPMLDAVIDKSENYEASDRGEQTIKKRED